MTHATESTVTLSGPDGARYEIPADVLEAARIPDEDVPALRDQVGGEAPDGDVAAYALDWATLSEHRVTGATAANADDTAGFEWRGGYFAIERVTHAGSDGRVGTTSQMWILIAPWQTPAGPGLSTKADRPVRPGLRENLYG